MLCVAGCVGLARNGVFSESVQQFILIYGLKLAREDRVGESAIRRKRRKCDEWTGGLSPDRRHKDFGFFLKRFGMGACFVSCFKVDCSSRLSRTAAQCLASSLQ